MTKEELAEIRERAELTPSGRWVWTSYGLTVGDFEELLLWVTQDKYNVLYLGAQEEVAEFIACAREDVIRLLDEVERLQKEVAEWESDQRCGRML